MTGAIDSEMATLAFCHTHPNTGVSICYGVGSGGYNRGIYDMRTDRWAVILNTNDYLTLIGEKIQLQPMSVGTAYKPYYEAGDSFNSTYWVGAGYITNGTSQVQFALPIDRPIIGSPTITMSYSLIIRQSGYKFGSGASTYATPTSSTITNRGSWIHVFANFDADTSATNNAACGIAWSGTITFS